MLLVALWAAGCSTEPAAVPSGPALRGLPVEMAVWQRSTTIVPGSDGALRLTVDDITHGQVMITLLGRDGETVLGATSLAAGGTAEFRLGGVLHTLTLKSLRNVLIGNDSATFVISAGPSRKISEYDKIECLLALVGAMKDAVLLRNEAEHTPQEAAEHLRAKWNSAGGRISTAREFVAQIASKSSITGEPYRIRFGDGRVMDLGAYLAARLDEIERGVPPAAAGR